MISLRSQTARAIVLLGLAAPAPAATVTLLASGHAPYELGSKVWLVGQLDGKNQFMHMRVNGIAGGNASVGTINEQNGEYVAPRTLPAGGRVTVTATTVSEPHASGSLTLTFKAATPAITSVRPARIACNQEIAITVAGARFDRQAVVWVNSHAVPTTFVSASALSARVRATAPGVLGVRVVSPVSGASADNWSLRADSGCSAAPAPAPTPTPPPTPTPTPTPPPVPPLGQQPAADPQQVAAARLLDQATFGATAADIAAVRSQGASAWLRQQFALPASPVPAGTDLDAVRRSWFLNMAAGPDQLRQRMIFALAQIFVVSADKNPYGNEIAPWLATLSADAFGNYKTLLRDMTLNPAMGKYLDLGNSAMPAPNENYAREVMQLFTVGPVLLNQDGSVQLDRNGDPLPAYDQATIAGMAHALSGWTYPGPSATGLNWEAFTGPLQPREAYHDHAAKTIVGGVTLAAGHTAREDLDAVVDTLFNHPNLPPFVATRLIRHFVTSNPSPAYVARVAAVFADGPAGRGDLKATLGAVLTDPEARADAPTATSGHLRDPILHSLGLVRALGGTVTAPANLFWDYSLQGEKLANAPSVFSFYSPLTRLPGDPQHFGPEFQLYAPALAVGRANFIYHLLAGDYAGMVKLDLSPFVAAAADPTALLNLVDARLLQGRMTSATRDAIGTALQASTDPRQRALTALYLAAISDFAVIQ